MNPEPVEIAEDLQIPDFILRLGQEWKNAKVSMHFDDWLIRRLFKAEAEVRRLRGEMAEEVI